MKMKDCRIVVRSFRKGDSKDRKKISSGAKKCSSDAKKCNSKGRNVAMNARKTFRSEETLARKTVRIAVNRVWIGSEVVKAEGNRVWTGNEVVVNVVGKAVAVKPRASGGN